MFTPAQATQAPIIPVGFFDSYAKDVQPPKDLNSCSFGQFIAAGRIQDGEMGRTSENGDYLYCYSVTNKRFGVRYSDKLPKFEDIKDPVQNLLAKMAYIRATPGLVVYFGTGRSGNPYLTIGKKGEFITTGRQSFAEFAQG